MTFEEYREYSSVNPIYRGYNRWETVDHAGTELDTTFRTTVPPCIVKSNTKGFCDRTNVGRAMRCNSRNTTDSAQLRCCSRYRDGASANVRSFVRPVTVSERKWFIDGTRVSEAVYLANCYASDWQGERSTEFMTGGLLSSCAIKQPEVYEEFSVLPDIALADLLGEDSVMLQNQELISYWRGRTSYAPASSVLHIGEATEPGMWDGPQYWSYNDQLGDADAETCGVTEDYFVLTGGVSMCHFEAYHCPPLYDQETGAQLCPATEIGRFCDLTIPAGTSCSATRVTCLETSTNQSLTLPKGEYTPHVHCSRSWTPTATQAAGPTAEPTTASPTNWPTTGWPTMPNYDSGCCGHHATSPGYQCIDPFNMNDVVCINPNGFNEESSDQCSHACGNFEPTGNSAFTFAPTSGGILDFGTALQSPVVYLQIGNITSETTARYLHYEFTDTYRLYTDGTCAQLPSSRSSNLNDPACPTYQFYKDSHITANGEMVRFRSVGLNLALSCDPTQTVQSQVSTQYCPLEATDPLNHCSYDNQPGCHEAMACVPYSLGFGSGALIACNCQLLEHGQATTTTSATNECTLSFLTDDKTNPQWMHTTQLSNSGVTYLRFQLSDPTDTGVPPKYVSEAILDNNRKMMRSEQGHDAYLLAQVIPANDLFKTQKICTGSRPLFYPQNAPALRPFEDVQGVHSYQGCADGYTEISTVEDCEKASQFTNSPDAPGAFQLVNNVTYYSSLTVRYGSAVVEDIPSCARRCYKYQDCKCIHLDSETGFCQMYTDCSTSASWLSPVSGLQKLERQPLHVEQVSPQQWWALPPGCIWAQSTVDNSWKMMFNRMRNLLSWNRPETVPHELDESRLVTRMSRPLCGTVFESALNVTQCAGAVSEPASRSQIAASLSVLDKYVAGNVTFVDRTMECMTGVCAPMLGCSVRLHENGREIEVFFANMSNQVQTSQLQTAAVPWCGTCAVPSRAACLSAAFYTAPRKQLLATFGMHEDAPVQAMETAQMYPPGQMYPPAQGCTALYEEPSSAHPHGRLLLWHTPITVHYVNNYIARHRFWTGVAQAMCV